MTHTLPFRARLAGLSLLCAAPVAFAQTPAAPAAAPSAAQSASAGKPPASAATPPAPPTSEAGAAVAIVSVAAERPTNRIDRQVHGVKSDLASGNGTAADALNNVPSVALAPDGTVTLRGSSNVQILIDGKPSAMLQGDNRGAALNALSSADIEAVEVINNPGAQFGNNAGGGPILNIVMRRNRRAGGFASLNANAGTAGRHNASVSGNYNEGRFGWQGGANVRHDRRNSVTEIIRDRIDPATGALSHSTQLGRAYGLNDSAGVNGTLTYNLGATDRLEAEAAYGTRSNRQQSEDRYQRFAPGPVAVGDYVRGTTRDGGSRNVSWSARLDHQGSASGERLKLDLSVSSSVHHSGSAYANRYAINPANAPDSRSHQGNGTENRIVDFTGDYERPTESGLVKLGYKIAGDKNSFDVRLIDIDPVTQVATDNAARSNRFELNETNRALYGSSQWRLDEQWGVLAGLRAEYTDLAMRQVASGIYARNSYVNYIPSFFATYRATEDATIRFSYAHRIRRPNATELNPFVQYRDELNVSSGNPRLRPTQADSVELGYETQLGKLEANLRAYYRNERDAILDRRYFINENVLLTTRDNGGGNPSSGLELSLNGKVTPALSMNTNGNLAHSEQRLGGESGADGKRNASSLSGRVRLSYQATDQDSLQLAVQTQGRTLVGQGYRRPNTTANVSIRHALTPMLNVVLNVTDAFDANRTETVVDTATLRETNSRRFDGRVVYLGLSYRLGAVAPDARKQ